MWSPSTASVTGSMKMARLSESPRPGVVNITRVVWPGAGAGRRAKKRASGPATARAASSCAARLCGAPWLSVRRTGR
ncbi:hypothetical protein QE401_004414 [Pseudoroseomonas cervicalis]|nr:hypothetical protein [Pseudoroseomonas cervicalis]MDQ1081821.1 hypothetical protein [Pseudoroseomonas cervicalis]